DAAKIATIGHRDTQIGDRPSEWIDQTSLRASIVCFASKHLDIIRQGRPKIAADLRALIRRISVENRLWGAPRIHGELLKLGFAVAQSTVANGMDRPCSRPQRHAESVGGFRRARGGHAMPSKADTAVARTIGI